MGSREIPKKREGSTSGWATWLCCASLGPGSGSWSSVLSPDLEHIPSAEPHLGRALGRTMHCSTAVRKRTILGRKGSFLAAQIAVGYQPQKPSK